MSKIRLFKSITWLVLASFIYSFVVHEPLFAIASLAREQAKTESLRNKLDGFVLPYKYGRFMGGEYSEGDKLVIFIQDLHCHPEVQKNIYEIIRLFDSRFGINRVLVEGAPSGRVDTGILSSIPGEKLRTNTLSTLLDKGLISGAEYYSVVENKDKLYGLEQWDMYRQNLSRIQKLFVFFQAEDGIRDKLVTGVQTCALPILQYLMLSAPFWQRITALCGKTNIN